MRFLIIAFSLAFIASTANAVAITINVPASIGSRGTMTTPPIATSNGVARKLPGSAVYSAT